jgi:[ribosomal protein S18]-alanine N-acetyltransferase
MLCTNSVTIRCAVESDIPCLIRLEGQCPTAAHWTEQQYQETLRCDGTGLKRLVLVADAHFSDGTPEASPRVLGFLVARYAVSEWELENIVVDPRAQRNGLGMQLLSALLARAKEAGAEAMFLEVRETNTPARKLYERTGFVRVGRRKSYYINPIEDAVVYRHTVVSEFSS